MAVSGEAAVPVPVMSIVVVSLARIPTLLVFTTPDSGLATVPSPDRSTVAVSVIVTGLAPGMVSTFSANALMSRGTSTVDDASG